MPYRYHVTSCYIITLHVHTSRNHTRTHTHTHLLEPGDCSVSLSLSLDLTNDRGNRDALSCSPSPPSPPLSLSPSLSLSPGITLRLPVHGSQTTPNPGPEKLRERHPARKRRGTAVRVRSSEALVLRFRRSGKRSSLSRPARPVHRAKNPQH